MVRDRDADDNDSDWSNWEMTEEEQAEWQYQAIINSINSTAVEIKRLAEKAQAELAKTGTTVEELKEAVKRRQQITLESRYPGVFGDAD